MVVITLDFETYYSKKEKYSLAHKDMTYERYIRDDRFEVIGLAYKIDDKPSGFLAPHEIKEWLDHIEIAYGWDNIRLVAHNARFDCAILGWVYGVYPKQIADTMLMSRAIKRWDGHSLDNLTKKLREHYNWGTWYNETGQAFCGVTEIPLGVDKGEEVHNADGKHLMDFTDEEYDAYAAYAMKDVDLTWSAYKWFTTEWDYPEKEIDVMTYTIEMFTYPVMELDQKVLLEVQKDIHEKRDSALQKTGLSLEDVRSDAKFAEALSSLGVNPPTKLNAKGETKYAFAKTDVALQKLLEHENQDVVDLVNARLSNKSSQVVTRVKSFIEMSERGALPIPIEYYAAHTGRWGGSDGLNVQNLNRNVLVNADTKYGQLVFYQGKADRFVQLLENGDVYLAKHGAVPNTEEDLHVVGLRDAFKAPKGKVLVVLDLSQIELRMNAFVAGEQWVLDALVAKQDIYKVAAAKSFGVTYEEVTKSQRYVGKQQELLLGYGGGENAIIRGIGKKAEDFTPAELKSWVTLYRETHPYIVKQWKTFDKVIKSMAQGVVADVDPKGILKCDGDSILLPNGMRIVYRGIKVERGSNGFNEIYFWGKNKITGKPDWEKTFGGKIDENCIAEDTEVLTDRGWVKIQHIQSEDKVFDGVEFVNHGGIIFKSEQSCVIIDGVYMTEDHEVLTVNGWKEAKQLSSWKTASSIQRLDRETLRQISCYEDYTLQRENTLDLAMRLWEHLSERWERFTQGYKSRESFKLWMLYSNTNETPQWVAFNEQASNVCSLAINEISVFKPKPQGLVKLWWSGYQSMSALVRQFREFSGRYVPNLQRWFDVGSNQQQWGLRQVKLSMGTTESKYKQPQKYSNNTNGKWGVLNPIRFLQKIWLKYNNRNLSLVSWGKDASVSGETRCTKKVYDIVNCGPRSRFVVKGKTGPFIVHNCVQALSRIILSDAMYAMREEFTARGWGRDKAHIVMQVHDEVITCCNEDIAEEVYAVMEDCLTRVPEWAEGLPLACDGDIAKRYGSAK